MKKEDIYYDRDDVETLHYDDKEEAISEILGMCLDCEGNYPKTLELLHYRRVKISDDPVKKSESIIEDLVEHLDENYRHDEDFTEATEEMKKHSFDFVKKIYDLYVPWSCESFKKEIIDCEKWINENEPKWLIEHTVDQDLIY